MKTDLPVCYAKHSEDGEEKSLSRKNHICLGQQHTGTLKEKIMQNKTKHLSAKLTRFE